MKKHCNVRIDDNGAVFLIVVENENLQRFVVCAFQSLGDAWRHIVWLYRIESQEFTVGEKHIPVQQWIKSMTENGFLNE